MVIIGVLEKSGRGKSKILNVGVEAGQLRRKDLTRPTHTGQASGQVPMCSDNDLCAHGTGPILDIVTLGRKNKNGNR